jgi:hypothetical protein
MAVNRNLISRVHTATVGLNAAALDALSDRLEIILADPLCSNQTPPPAPLPKP